MTLLGLVNNVRACAMIDSGASNSFIDKGFVQKHSSGFRLIRKSRPQTLLVVDGSESKAGSVPHKLDVNIIID